jgi:eukaryotic-like serine/threonine-protein kinase
VARKTISNGAYEVIERRGAGAMGEVFRGRDTSLNRPVALKFLKTEIASSDKARKRFITEMRSLAQLGHPNLATIYSAGEENGQPYMVMEFIEGTALEEVIRRGPLPVGVAAQILLEVLAGIEHAHGKGIVHRDLKPSNILLTRDGHVKVIDFGIALDQDSERRTIAGDVLCTPAYASPEQAAGKIKEIDRQSDVYSLGAVLFEMLTGSPPLEKESNQATLIAHVTEDVPPIPEHFGGPLAGVVSKALARGKDKRFRSTGEFEAALVAAVGSLESKSVTEYLSQSAPRETVIEIPPDDLGKTAPKKPPRTRSRRISWMVYVGAGLFVVAACIGLWILMKVRELSVPIPPPTVELRVPPPPKGWDIVPLRQADTGSVSGVHGPSASTPKSSTTHSAPKKLSPAESEELNRKKGLSTLHGKGEDKK